jgi:hypothetical protein
LTDKNCPTKLGLNWTRNQKKNQAILSAGLMVFSQFGFFCGSTLDLVTEEAGNIQTRHISGARAFTTFLAKLLEDWLERCAKLVLTVIH